MFYIEKQNTYGNWERFKITLRDRKRAERIAKELMDYNMGAAFRVVEV